MTFIPIFPASYPQPPFFMLGFLFPYVFVLACVGVVLGFILERVRVRFVMAGSALYWVFAFVLVLYFSSVAAFWSMFLVLFADVTYGVRYIVGRRRKVAAGFSLGLRNRLGLMVAVAVVLVGFVLWITWSENVLGSFATLLQGCAVALVAWVLLAYREKPVGLVEFVGKGFVVSFVLTLFLWFVNVWADVSWVLSSVLWIFSVGFGVRILPFSLLPVAVCVTAYGVFRKPLPAWVILVSSWYVAIYAVFAAYEVWWLVFIYPYLTVPPYFSGGGLIARDLLLMFLAFVVALIFTGIYVWLKKPKQIPPP